MKAPDKIDDSTGIEKPRRVTKRPLSGGLTPWIHVCKTNFYASRRRWRSPIRHLRNRPHVNGFWPESNRRRSASCDATVDHWSAICRVCPSAFPGPLAVASDRRRRWPVTHRRQNCAASRATIWVRLRSESTLIVRSDLGRPTRSPVNTQCTWRQQASVSYIVIDSATTGNGTENS